MRRDTKLGLALGLLAIGFAFAFCFPRHSPSVAWMTLDAPVPIADSGLDVLPIRAYQPTSAGAAASHPTSQKGNTSDTIELHASRSAPASKGQQVPVAPPAAILETIPPLRPPVEAAPAGRNNSPGADLAPTATTYRVRSGDTLSRIASRVLGDGQRYLELYECNKDRLSSPHDLPVGLELRLPTTSPVANRSGLEPTARTSASPPRMAEGELKVPAPWPGGRRR